MKHKPCTIIFDFDYTLADSSEGVIDCINYGLDRLGLPPQTPQRIRSTIGLSLPDTLVELVGSLTPDQITEFRRQFVKRADVVMADKTIVFPTVRRTVEILQNQGLNMGIVSTKFRYRIQAILKRENLIDFFKVVIGGEDVTQHKPDPEGLQLAVKSLNATSESTLYVGDSVTDARTAQRAGLPFVAVLTGVTPAAAFADYPVARMINDLSELPGIF